MPNFSGDLIGYPQVNRGRDAGAVEEYPLGTILTGMDEHWGGGEFVYCIATAALAGGCRLTHHSLRAPQDLTRDRFTITHYYYLTGDRSMATGTRLITPKPGCPLLPNTAVGRKLGDQPPSRATNFSTFHIIC